MTIEKLIIEMEANPYEEIRPYMEKNGYWFLFY